MDKSKNPAVPLIAVPTTAGTARNNHGLRYYQHAGKAENGVYGLESGACGGNSGHGDHASLPLSLTAATAMDALTHAVESYLSKGAFSFSEMLSLKAVSLISENFIRVIKEPGNYEVRKELAIAQYLAGMSFTNVGLGIVHSMAHPLSAFYDIPHGTANALILPYVLEFNAAACPEKIRQLAAAFDLPSIHRRARRRQRRIVWRSSGASDRFRAAAGICLN